jgi:Tol biopolymer transport system component
VKRLLALCGIAASLAVSVAADTSSAPPRALLTFSVVYGSERPGGPGGGLCLARSDGSKRLRLTRRNIDRAASWSPNGRAVVFTRGTPGRAVRILVADTRGRVLRELKPEGPYADPAWAPDGRRIAYVSLTGGSHIVVATAATGRVVTEMPARVAPISRPAWSPDGKRIAYAEQVDIDREAQAGSSRIVVVNADGTGRRVLVGQASDPAWSPDGSKLAYVAYASRFAESGDIAVANADGTGARNLMTTPAAEWRPAWSPTGRVIAFARGSDSASVIVSVPNAGGAERILVRSRAYGAADPAWRRPVLLPRARRVTCS